jgi:hypothetical protein
MSVILNIVSAFDSKGIKNAQKAFAQLETNTQKASFALKKYGGPAALASIGAIILDTIQQVQELVNSFSQFGGVGLSQAGNDGGVGGSQLPTQAAIDAEIINNVSNVVGIGL